MAWSDLFRDVASRIDAHNQGQSSSTTTSGSRTARSGGGNSQASLGGGGGSSSGGGGSGDPYADVSIRPAMSKKWIE